MIKSLFLVLCLCLFQIVGAQQISISSSSKELESAFEWAKNKALSYVMTGKIGPVNISEINHDTTKVVSYIPSFWAGYPGRTAFYSRDFCHQSTGAFWLGLDKENFSMLKTFCSTSNEKRKWYPLWAINFDGSDYVLDYHNDDDFVREVPVVFELIEAAYNLYLRTGDSRYLTDDMLWNFYTKIVTDFISLHDKKMPNGVPEGSGELHIFKGVASYNEHDKPLLEAGDAIANQYDAFLAYSKMASLRGDKATACLFSKKAKELYTYFNTKWGIEGTQLYNRGYGMDKKPQSDWGKENSWFMPMKGITDPNSLRTNNFLDFIEKSMDTKEMKPDNIEAISYLPEVFFRYHQNERGWKWMKYIIAARENQHLSGSLTGTNGDYPEISFLLVSNIVEQLAGLMPNAGENRVSTTPHLPGEIETLTINHARIGNKLVSITHLKTESTSLSYENGNEPIIWEANFPGEYHFIYADGKKIKSKQKNDNGTICSYCELTLQPGDQKQLSVNP